MKKIIIYKLLFLFTLFVSCTDSSSLLDPEVSTGIDGGDIFKSAKYAEQNLLDIYDQLLPVIPNSASGTRWRSPDVFLDAVSDDGHAEAQWGSSPAFNQGAWSASSGNFSNADWEMYWSSIRNCNIFISNIDNVPDNSQLDFNNEKRKLRKAEAIFLLAWNYAELLKEFGGLPIITDPTFDLSSTNQELVKPRATYDETVDFISDLCDEAAKVLPESWEGIDYGRVTKGAALALKARILLHAASPLWNNPEKPEDSPFRGAYSPDKWIKAAEAAAVLLKMEGVYQLLPIEKLFLTRVNKEFIFARMQRPQSYVTGLSFTPAFYTTSFNNGGINQVTYNMIKQYEIIKDGKAYDIEDPNSGYNAQDPYKNRDPRFYRDCLFNGCKILDQKAEFDMSGDGVAPKGAYNDPYQGSMDTYVYSIKFADTHLKINWDNRFYYRGEGAEANFPYLRFAEMYLNYAEAMNEAFGPDVDGLNNGMTALWALNKVRTRAKYPSSSTFSNYPDGELSMPPVMPGLSKEQFRERVRRERRVEFAYEEFRFWDVRRWKIPVEELTTIQAQIPVWYMENGKKVVRYEIRTSEVRVMDTKMYRMPIPESQIFANPNLVQNPGWPFSPEDSE